MERTKLNLEIETVYTRMQPLTELLEKLISDIKRLEKEYNLDCTLSLKVVDYPLVKNSTQ